MFLTQETSSANNLKEIITHKTQTQKLSELSTRLLPQTHPPNLSKPAETKPLKPTKRSDSVPLISCFRSASILYATALSWTILWTRSRTSSISSSMSPMESLESSEPSFHIKSSLRIPTKTCLIEHSTSASPSSAVPTKFSPSLAQTGGLSNPSPSTSTTSESDPTESRVDT